MPKLNTSKLFNIGRAAVDSGQMAFIPISEDELDELPRLTTAVKVKPGVYNVGVAYGDAGPFGERVAYLEMWQGASAKSDAAQIAQLDVPSGYVLVSDPCYYHDDDDLTGEERVTFLHCWGSGQKLLREYLDAEKIAYRVVRGLLAVPVKDEQDPVTVGIFAEIDDLAKIGKIVVTDFVHSDNPYDNACDATSTEESAGLYVIDKSRQGFCSSSGCGDGMYGVWTDAGDGEATRIIVDFDVYYDGESTEEEEYEEEREELED